MRKLLVFFFIFLISFSIQAQGLLGSKQVFSSPSLPSLLASAKKVAILPFKVVISYKKMPKGLSTEQIKENEKQESFQLQQGMYTYLLRKSNDYTVSFQDVDKTNALLKKNDITDSFDEMIADSICKILGVDAIIKSTWNYSKTGSEAGAIATAVLLGGLKSTASGLLILQLHGAKDGEMAWRMSKEMNESAFSSANELMERMMRKVGRNFPFEK